MLPEAQGTSGVPDPGRGQNKAGGQGNGSSLETLEETWL